jgi:hypothetical protein
LCPDTFSEDFLEILKKENSFSPTSLQEGRCNSGSTRPLRLILIRISPWDCIWNLRQEYELGKGYFGKTFYFLFIEVQAVNS